jgi:hypothetical protein
VNKGKGRTIIEAPNKAPPLDLVKSKSKKIEVSSGSLAPALPLANKRSSGHMGETTTTTSAQLVLMVVLVVGSR